MMNGASHTLDSLPNPELGLIAGSSEVILR
jgi:hypothetical protein